MNQSPAGRARNKAIVFVSSCSWQQQARSWAGGDLSAPFWTARPQRIHRPIHRAMGNFICSRAADREHWKGLTHPPHKLYLVLKSPRIQKKKKKKSRACSQGKPVNEKVCVWSPGVPSLRNGKKREPSISSIPKTSRI